jgi:hypothetical protein
VREKLDAGTVGRDIVRYGTAIFLTVALGVVQLFVIPRRVDMATYGAYRLFLVYAAYVGILHFGLADGAFLRWAGRPAGVIRANGPRRSVDRVDRGRCPRTGDCRRRLQHPCRGLHHFARRVRSR